jgi:MbtH protein
MSDGTSIFDDDEAEFLVVLNDEEQYSIWPTFLDMPAGWRTEGTRGKKQHCLGHIREIWTDMRPKSLRESMAADVEEPPAQGTEGGGQGG